MTNHGEVERTPARDPLGFWSVWCFLAGALALALGAILTILGVSAAGLFLPGVHLLQLALVLLAATGILRALRP